MLEALLGSKLRARLLGWLLTHPDERFYVRRLHAILGEDPTNVSRELARLAQMGILTCAVEGQQKYYQADRKCPVFGELRALVVKTAGLADVLREALRPLSSRIRVAFIYGSHAAGSANASSDVDVLAVGDVSFAEVVDALAPAQERLRREVNPTVYGAKEFRRKVAAGHHFLKSVLAGPKILLVGDSDDLAGLAEERVGDGSQDESARDRRPPRRRRARPRRLSGQRSQR
jgi:predicted nucleotidyltransferase